MVEKILQQRPSADGTGPEYMVKLASESYRNVEWMGAAELARRSPSLLGSYLRRIENAGAQAAPVRRLVQQVEAPPPFDPRYLEMERVIAESKNDNLETVFLVKWKELG